MFRADFYRQLTHPTVGNSRELIAYVVRTTVACGLIALSADVLNQLVFFVDWQTAFRSWTITLVLASAIALVATIAIGRAHLELYLAKLVVERLSRIDPLTGLPNRRAFFEVAETTAPEAMILIIIDVDHFKEINDTRGHLVGDEAIRIVSRMMAVELAELGYIGRIGGDEFAIVGSGIDNKSLLACLINFHVRLAATPILVFGKPISVSISAGVSIRAPGQSLNDLYADADRALYSAKLEGRSRVHYSPSFEKTVGGSVAENEERWRADGDADRRRSENKAPVASVA